MTNEQIVQVAREQSAMDLNCSPEDFERGCPVIVESRPHPRARKYLELPFSCDLVSYGTNVVASVDPRYREPVSRYVGKYAAEHCFETPNMYVLNQALEKDGLQICFMAEYFLPDVDSLSAPACECGCEWRILGPEDFESLYRPEWSNALCEKRKQLDVLGVGAYREDRLIGLAGCSADCDSMWQIGIDVLPEARRQGIASALTSRLAVETLKRGKVPFYCCAWSNVRSARTAIRSGFRPAWVEMTARPMEFVNEMNR